MVGEEILSPEFDRGIALFSRKGNEISTVRRNRIDRKILRERDRAIRSSLPDIKTRSLDSSYNCVGMVFAFRRAWVEPKHVSQLLKDDEYHEVHQSKTMVGDLIVYYADDDRKVVRHVGIIVEKTGDVEAGEWIIRVLSKWGSEGEYLHCEKDVPTLFGQTRVYFSERK